MNTSSVRGAPPPLANHGNNNGNAAVAVAAPAASAAAQTTNTAPPTGCTVDTSQLGLLQALTRERQGRSTDLAQHRSQLQSLTHGLSSTLADNAALRRLLADRDEELLLLETKLAVCGAEQRAAHVQDVLRGRQRTLLGLYHASSCKVVPPSVCPVEHCGGYRRLLHHVHNCPNAMTCPTEQCRTASCLLRHVGRCLRSGGAAACPLCRPLREAIRHEEEVTAAARTMASFRQSGAPPTSTAAAAASSSSTTNGATHPIQSRTYGDVAGDSGGSMVRGGGAAAAALGTSTSGARKEQQQQPQPMQIEPSQSQQQKPPPEVRQPPQYQYHPTPAAEAAAAATEKTGMPPHLRSKRPTQRRRVVVASPLTPINPNQRPTANSLFSRSSSSSSSSTEKKKGSVATSTSLLARTRPRRDSVSLSSSTSTSRARFTQQQLLQSRDESSAGTCSEATSSSIDTRTSTGSDAAEKIVSVGIVPCEACSDRGDGRTSIPMCQECERANLGLLLHASACRSGGACTVVHCGDMKMRLRHMETCDTGFAGGCRACRYVFPLLRLHALQCPRDDCTLPSCASLKSCANCNGNSIHLATRDGEESRPSLCETCQAVLPPALLHSANCTDSGTCGFPRCDQMSAHIAHWMACPDGLSCRVCRRYTAIVRGHAIDCTDPKCGVSSCGAAKASLFRASLFRASI